MTKPTSLDERAGRLIVEHIAPILNSSPKEGNAGKLLTAFKQALLEERRMALEEAAMFCLTQTDALDGDYYANAIRAIKKED